MREDSITEIGLDRNGKVFITPHGYSSYVVDKLELFTIEEVSEIVNRVEPV